MIDIGTLELSDAYIGSTSIEKAYLDSTLVWEKNVPTIEDADGKVYKIRNYINVQKDVHQCSIGVYPNFPADGFEAKIKFASDNRQYVIGGGYNKANARMLGIETVTGVLKVMYHNKTLDTGVDVRSKTVVITAVPDTDANVFRVSVDGVSKVTNALITVSAASRYFYVGKFYNMTQYGAVNGNRIYYLKYYRNGEAIRDMIPVEDEDGVYAFFDKVNLKAYYSNGSDQFTGG